jgi:tetratricopeptide (TPR) repeat protein
VTRQLTKYRVFIGSPGGLVEERNCFRSKLEKFSALHGEHRGALFHPVGWEDTIGGVGRPQALINEDLKQCDYAVFVLHDRWGTPTGSGHMSGTEEEWALAEGLYQANKVRNIALFFEEVDQHQPRNPGDQLKLVLAFKKRIEEGKRYLFREYGALDQFADLLEGHLAQWLRDHETPASGLSLGKISEEGASAECSAKTRNAAVEPGFDYWMAEANRLSKADIADYAGASFCALRAIGAAKSDIEWAQARNAHGVIQSGLGNHSEAVVAFAEIAGRFSSSIDPDRCAWEASALSNKGAVLGALGRSEEAIAAYDDVVARFGTATEPALREPVANALFNKGVTLGELARGEEAIAAYDDVLAGFGIATEPSLREQVARALLGKGSMLDALGRSEEAIAAYDDVLARFGTAALREEVAQALVHKGFMLGGLGRSEEAIAVYDDVLTQFGTATELALRDKVAMALVGKGVRLGALGRSEEAIAAFGDALARFGNATEPALHDRVALALVGKGVMLSALGRSEEAIAAYDDVVARFGTATELALRERVADALVNKGVTLGELARSEEAIAAYDDVFPRFGAATEPDLREPVANARSAAARKPLPPMTMLWRGSAPRPSPPSEKSLPRQRK